MSGAGVIKVPESIILIRRDNIGDLVCTTPAIRALRLKFPGARIALLVNSYNAEVLRGNPDIDDVYIYEKAKHNKDKSGLKIAFDNLRLIREIRKKRFDCSIGCGYNYSPRLARYTWLTGGKARIGCFPKGKASSFFYNAGIEGPEVPLHEAVAMMRLLKPLGIEGEPPKQVLKPDSVLAGNTRQYLEMSGLKKGEKIILFQISSRKPENRWPKESFRELADMVHGIPGLRVLLLWAPGSPDNPLHPGDDDKAEWIISSMKKKPLVYRTNSLSELIAVMSLGSLAVTSDGGAMHIAAALDMPVLSVWGSTDERRWSPWGVPYIILQKETKRADSVASAEAFEAFKELFSKHLK